MDAVTWGEELLIMSAITNGELDAQTASRREKEFLVILAHELRNPLSAIRSAAHRLHHQSMDSEAVEWALWGWTRAGIDIARGFVRTA